MQLSAIRVPTFAGLLISFTKMQRFTEFRHQTAIRQKDKSGPEIRSALAMSLETVSFVAGAILVFVGVLGGGMELRELKVPKIGSGVRVLATLVGLVFICLGMGLHSPPAEAATAGPSAGATRASFADAPKPVEFTIVDELDKGEVSEQITLLVDGKNVGDLTINSDYPQSKLRVTVPQAGQHSYTAEGSAVLLVGGRRTPMACAGQGMIYVEPGKTYRPRGSITGNTFLVTLEQDQ